MSLWPRLAAQARRFEPRTVQNLALWLDAANAASLTFNGNNVSAWSDLSGNARDFSQSTAAAQPIGTRTYNGRRVLDFQGAQRLSGNAASLNIARNVGALTMFVAGQFDTLAASSAFVFVSRNGSTAQGRASLSYNYGLNQALAGGRRTDADAFAAAGYAPNTDANVLTGVLDYTNSDAFIFQNGTQQNSNTLFHANGNTSNTDSDIVVIGSIGDGTQSLDGWIAEIIVYQRALRAAERQRVERYLGRKWGITVA